MIIIIWVCIFIAVLFLTIAASGYSRQMRERSNNMQQFAETMDDKLAKAGKFSPELEAKILAGDITAEESRQYAREIRWYTHTRHCFFNPNEPDADREPDGAENWLRTVLHEADK